MSCDTVVKSMRPPPAWGGVRITRPFLAGSLTTTPPGGSASRPTTPGSKGHGTERGPQPMTPGVQPQINTPARNPTAAPGAVLIDRNTSGTAAR